MSIKDGLRQFLVGDGGVNALVGERVGQKAAQGWPKPYVTFRVVGTSYRRHLRGSTGLRQTTIRISCVGRSWDEAQSVAAAVYAAIGEDGVSKVEWDDQAVSIAHWEDRGDEFAGPQHGDEAGIPQESLNLVVWHGPA